MGKIHVNSQLAWVFTKLCDLIDHKTTDGIPPEIVLDFLICRIIPMVMRLHVCHYQYPLVSVASLRHLDKFACARCSKYCFASPSVEYYSD